MPTRLDEISRAIGSLEAGVDNLQNDMSAIVRRMDAREAVQDRRHRENQDSITAAARDNLAAVNASKAAVQQIMDTVRPLSEAVAAMQPTVNALAASRTRIAILAGIGVIAVWFVGRALEAMMGSASTWLIGKLFH